MGCSIGVKHREVTNEAPSHIKNLDELKIQPGLFVQENTKLFHEVYRISQSLGSGSFGEVRLTFNRETQRKFAVKIFRKKHLDPSKLAMYSTEVEILKAVDHPNIIRVYEYFNETNAVYLVLEYCSGGELFTEITKRVCFCETDAALIMKQLFSAVSYLHSKQIIHRDLKPENILLEDKQSTSNIKLIDFSTSVFASQDGVSGKTGTVYYIAPEVLKSRYNEKCDVWSCGVILYILLAGYPPFDGSTDTEILQNITIGKVDLQSEPWPSISPDAKNLLSNLLCEQSLRLSSSAALRHPWCVKAQRASLPPSVMSSSMEKLKTFCKSTKIRSAVETFIISQCISIEELRVLREVFRSIDTNCDGRLSKEELLVAYASVVDPTEREEQVELIIRQVDIDHNGYIDYTEFITATVDSARVLSAKNLRCAFSKFDVDSSGKISAEELKRVLQGSAASEDCVWQGIIRELDQNGDGEIDWEEFSDLLLSKV